MSGMVLIIYLHGSYSFTYRFVSNMSNRNSIGGIFNENVSLEVLLGLRETGND